MDLRCPKCNSTDLKKVSLAYQEGLYRTDARTRLSAAVVGGNGPDLVVGRATTKAAQQSAAICPFRAAEPSSEMVVPKGPVSIASGVSLHRLDRLLRRHRYDERHNRDLGSVDAL